MDVIKQTTGKWGGFIATALVYMLISGLTDFGFWLADVGREGFLKADMYDMLKISSQIILSMLVMLRGLMNGSYGDAKDQPQPSGKLKLE